MKFRVNACAAAALAATLCAAAASAFAQNSPGVPGGILGGDFQFQQHPQLEFAASAPSNKYQHGKPSDARRRGDLGDQDGCNLKCAD